MPQINVLTVRDPSQVEKSRTFHEKKKFILKNQPMRRIFVLVLLFLIFQVWTDLRGAFQEKGSQEVEVVSPPNILLIMVDDLGYGDLSSAGAQDLRTPAIDALGELGIWFSQFYANSPVSSPTRAALLTGRYPDLVGVPGVIRTESERSWGYLVPEILLLPELLQNAGYHTALIGKWHLGLESPNIPTERGFQFFHGFLGDMMDDYYNHYRRGVNYMRLNTRTIEPIGHATDLFTQWAIEYLDNRKDINQPFFLLLSYNAPHTPIQPPPLVLERVRQRGDELTEDRAKLVALIEHLDEGIGRVIKVLGDNQQEGNTVVIFVSDNGGDLRVGANCGLLRGGKRDLYEGGIRVPMAAVWPGKIRPGSSSRQLAIMMDLFPTICAIAGVKITQDFDGVSLLGTLVGQMTPPLQRELFWMRREGGRRHEGQDYYAVRRGYWKLMQNSPFERYKLFNLRDDPLEEHDLADQEPGVRASLSQALRRQIQKAGAIPWQPR